MHRRMHYAVGIIGMTLVATLLVVLQPTSPAAATEDGQTHEWWGTITIIGRQTDWTSYEEGGGDGGHQDFSATLTRSRTGAYTGYAKWNHYHETQTLSECDSNSFSEGNVAFPQHTTFSDEPVRYDAATNSWIKSFPQIWVPTLVTMNDPCGGGMGQQHWFDQLIGHNLPDSLNLSVLDSKVKDIPAPRVTETKHEVLVDTPAPYQLKREVTISYDVSWDSTSSVDVVDPDVCARPQPKPGAKDYLYTTVEGKSRWVMTVAPDIEIGTFDVGLRWCTTPDGPGFREQANVYSQVNTNWFLQGILETIGFTLESKTPTVSMSERTAKIKGRIVLAFNPVKVALNFVPVTRLLDKVATHIDDCFLKIAGGIHSGQATRELAEALYSPVKKIKAKIRRKLQDQLDKKMTTVLAIKLSHRWTRGFDHAADAMTDFIVGQVRTGNLGLNMGKKLAGDAFEFAFGTVEYTLWRPSINVTIKNSGKADIENRSDGSPGVEDEWKDKTVT